MSAESLQRNGKAAYEKGDYSKALEYFNRAVGRGDPSIKLLDNVSATHVKLGSLHAALTSAKQTIKAGREDATGYVRAGHILKQMGKHSTALEIYAYGLKSIKHVGAGFEKLKTLHDELQHQLAPKNSLDPLTVLPRELAVAVLEYLSFRQRIAVCRVSDGWTKFIRSEASLWAHLDLTGAKKKVRSSFISTAINVARSKIIKATLNRVFDFDKVLHALVKHCPLKSVVLLEIGFQGHNLVDGLRKAVNLKEIAVSARTDMTPTMLANIAEACRSTIESVQYESQHKAFGSASLKCKLPSMPHLRSLDLKSPCVELEIQSLDIIAVSSGLETLKLHVCTFSRLHLDLRACAILTIVDLHIKTSIAVDALRLPHSVKILRLHADQGLLIPHGPGADIDFSWHLPYLQEVSLGSWSDRGSNFGSITEQISIMKGEDASTPSLESLKLEGALIEREEDLALPVQFRHLHHLSVPNCGGLKDKHVDIILRNAPDLDSLDLSGTPITGVAVRSIVKAGHLKKVVLNRCHEVSRDAIDWARTTGLQVEANDMNKF